MNSLVLAFALIGGLAAVSVAYSYDYDYDEGLFENFGAKMIQAARQKRQNNHNNNRGAYGPNQGSSRNQGFNQGNNNNQGGFNSNQRGGNNNNNGGFGGSQTTPISILKYENVNNGDGTYNYNYETANGITAEERGYLKNPGSNNEIQAVQGSYQYYSPEGQLLRVTYTADEDGFKPVGDHLPTPPPIPEAIQKALAIIYANAAQQKSSGGNNNNNGQFNGGNNHLGGNRGRY